jgi:hypothetical protein
MSGWLPLVISSRSLEYRQNVTLMSVLRMMLSVDLRACEVISIATVLPPPSQDITRDYPHGAIAMRN